MNILNKLKRLYYKLGNSDPFYNCEYRKVNGCAIVDSPYCSYPNCHTLKNYLGDNWVCCVECRFQDLCSSKQFGLGCYNGEKV